jgi:coenzyme PQQ synthesis protein D (PqqD)
MPTVQFSRGSIVVACEGHISCDLAGEAAVLDFKSGIYYGLDEVGASIWKLIAEPRAVGEICDAITAEYDVAPDTCERDVIVLLGELAARGLVELRDAAPTL